MSNQRTFTIAVFEGDGIGPEITPPCRDLLDQACARVNEQTGKPDLSLSFQSLPAGAVTYRETGEALPDSSVDAARQADAILMAAMGDPSIRYPDGTEIIPQVELRFKLGLYAGFRPVRSIPGVPCPLADPRSGEIDFVLVRESIEGLFAPQAPGRIIDDSRAEETLVITRETSEKLFDATYALARRRQLDRLARLEAGGTMEDARKSRVTCIDKANIFPAFAFFRRLFHEAAKRNETSGLEGSLPCESDHAYVDIMAHNLVTRPWEYDVMVTENMFGDILSDLGAALIGGMGYAPSADIGDDHAVFQPCHGSAPDIVGRGIANPIAMFLSGAMMLDWLAERHDCDAAARAGRLIVRAIDEAFASGHLRTVELGGESRTADVVKAVSQRVATLAV